MKRFLTIVFSVVLASFTQLAWGQSGEEAFGAAGQDQPVKLYPSPATEYLTVQFEQPVARKVKLSLHNIIGNVVEVETEVIDDHEVRVKVKDLPSGVYLIAIKGEDHYKSAYKFLKR